MFHLSSLSPIILEDTIIYYRLFFWPLSRAVVIRLRWLAIELSPIRWLFVSLPVQIVQLELLEVAGPGSGLIDLRGHSPSPTNALQLAGMQSGSELVRTGIRVRYTNGRREDERCHLSLDSLSSCPFVDLPTAHFSFVQIQYPALTGSVDHGAVVTALLDSWSSSGDVDGPAAPRRGSELFGVHGWFSWLSGRVVYSVKINNLLFFG